MHEHARKLLETLVSSPETLSRNRHFSLFDHKTAATLRRRAALIRMLCDKLTTDQAQLVSIQEGTEQVELHLVYEGNVFQKTWLSRSEYDIFRERLKTRAAQGLLEGTMKQEGVHGYNEG